MKLLISGDWQIEAAPTMDRLDERGRSIRFKEHQELLFSILREGENAGAKVMVHLGDLTEHRNPSSLEANAAAKLFSYWLNTPEHEIWSIPGNHDGTDFLQSSSSFEPLYTMAGSRFLLFHEISIYSPSPRQPIFVFIPYLHGRTIEEIGELHKKALDSLKKFSNAPKYLFMHYGVSGVQVGAKNLVLPGDHLTSEQLFPHEYKAIFAGHIHKQQIMHMGETPIIFPGSPAVCDFGERHDQKGYCILDTDTGKWELRQCCSKRRWIQVEWPIEWPPIKEGEPWTENDVVKITGEYPRGIDIHAEMEELYRQGLPRPFAMSWAAVPQRSERVARGNEVAEADSLLDAAKDLAKKQYPDNSLVEPALKLVAEALREGRKPPFSSVIIPTELEVHDFLTYSHIHLTDMAVGEPTLISGPNGLGKTNLQEAILFALTGRTSKGLNMGDLVRQGQKKALVRLRLEGKERHMTIERVINKTKAGGTQKVKVVVGPLGDDPGYTLDGNIADVQKSLDELLGVGYLGLKTTNFMFQKDPDPFTRTDPGERKKILADIQCLEPVYRAFKALNDNRLVKQRVVLEATAEVKAVDAFKPTKSLDELLQQKEKAVKSVQDNKIVIEQVSSNLENAKDRQRGSRGNIESLLEQIGKVPDYSGRIEGLKRELAQVEDAHKATRERLLKQYNEAATKLDTLKSKAPIDIAVLEAEIRDYELKLAEEEKAVSDAKEKLTKAETAFGIAVLEVTRFEKELSKAEGMKEGKCSLCGQTITADHLTKEIALLKDALEKAKNTFKHEEENVKVCKDEVSRLSKVCAQTKEKLNLSVKTLADARGHEALKIQLQETLNFIRNQGQENNLIKENKVKQITKELEELKEKSEESSKIRGGLSNKLAEAKTIASAIDNEVVALEAKVRAIQASQAEADRNLALVEQEILSLNKWEQEAKARKERLEKAKLDADIAQLACSIVDPKGGLPVYLVDTQLPLIEERANYYMARLGMPDLRISMSTVEGDKETLAVLVDNGFEPRLDIRAYSGGQLDRVEIALKFAMSDLAKTYRGSLLGLMCLDEPTGGLDDAGKQALAELLFERCASDYPCTYIVSHDPRMASAFPRRLMVTKGEDGATKLF
jgi:DNA repair exonuclease SbcCD ATPase subunit/DNA repair exonuclease SbcCD nuclease subunit